LDPTGGKTRRVSALAGDGPMARTMQSYSGDLKNKRSSGNRSIQYLRIGDIQFGSVYIRE
jgi:hypothetical protein